MISYAYDMAVDSRYVYILALSEGKWLHVYDKHDGRYYTPESEALKKLPRFFIVSYRY